MFEWDFVRANAGGTILETLDSGSGTPPKDLFAGKIAATSNSEKFKFRGRSVASGAAAVVTGSIVFNQWKK